MRSLDDVVSEIGRKITNHVPEIERAKIVYEWMLQNVSYDVLRKCAINYGLASGEPLRPEETILCGKGVCSDLAVLYVAISRRLDLPAFYACVDRDEKGQSINHAIAIIDLPKQKLQVDPAMRIFNAHHLSCRMEEPDALKGHARQPAVLYRLPRLKTCWQKFRASLAAFALLGAAWYGYSFSTSPHTPKNITYLQTENTERFVTKHGNVKFAINEDARQAWEEALFFIEALHGDAQDPEMLDALLSADKDRNNHITKEEADGVRALVRSNYVRERQ